MFILVLKDYDDDGAFSIIKKDGTRVLCIFEEEDDALRYIGLLEAEGYPSLDIIEADSELISITCETLGYNYCVITSNDFVLPPNTSRIEFI